MKEIWKPVLDYIGFYDASNYGRVRSLDRYEVVGKTKRFRKGRILKPCKKKNGYLYVRLSKNGITKNFYVHRLVYEAFNGTIPDGYEVNHINEIKTDNRYPENLNLMTSKENANWGTRNQRTAEKQSDTVLQLTPDGQLVKEWPSSNEAGRNGFDQGHIVDCCNGKRNTHKGFLWMKKLPLCQWYNYTYANFRTE